MVNFLLFFICGLLVGIALNNIFKINKNPIFISVLNGLQFILIYNALGFSYSSFLYYIFFSTIITLAFIDLKQQIVPNKAIVFLMFLGLVSLFVQPNILIANRVLGFFIVSVPILIIATVTNGFGGGDVKLFAVCGFLLGTQKIVLATFIAIITAGIFSVFLLIVKGKNSKDAIAFVPFIFIGLLTATLYGQQIVNLYLNLFFNM